MDKYFEKIVHSMLNRESILNVSNNINEIKKKQTIIENKIDNMLMEIWRKPS